MPRPSRAAWVLHIVVHSFALHTFNFSLDGSQVQLSVSQRSQPRSHGLAYLGCTLPLPLRPLPLIFLVPILPVPSASGPVALASSLHPTPARRWWPRLALLIAPIFSGRLCN